jgi:hypothetical protein
MNSDTIGWKMEKLSQRKTSILIERKYPDMTQRAVLDYFETRMKRKLDLGQYVDRLIILQQFYKFTQAEREYLDSLVIDTTNNDKTICTIMLQSYQKKGGQYYVYLKVSAEGEELIRGIKNDIILRYNPEQNILYIQSLFPDAIRLKGFSIGKKLLRVIERYAKVFDVASIHVIGFVSTNK